MAKATDVLVIGAGPTGLTLACELARRGLAVRIVDQAAAPTTLSKAIALHARSLEVLDDLGVADTLVERGKKLLGATMWAGGEPIVRADFDELDSRYNFLLALSQAETEAVLSERLAGLGVEVERESRLVSFRQDGTGVTARISVKDAEPIDVRAAWLVGADGAHSTVRKQLELVFEGATYDERFLLADVKIAWDTRDDRVSTWFGEDGVVACFPMPGDRWRVIAAAPPGDEKTEDPTLEEVQAIFDRRTATSAVLSDAAWLARFRIHCRQVSRYRDDRVFVAGDAAHIHSPIGGQGMNTGIQDAHNLAWKLALVHRGDARDALLDSYEGERHAVGQAVLRGTDAATKVATLKSPMAKAARNEIARVLTGFEFVQQRITREVSELSIGYESSPIVKEDLTSLLEGRIGTAAGGESPTIATVREFGGGPRAGQRARDGKVTIAGESGTKRLLEVIDATKLTLLLFDGRSDSAGGYQRFAAIEAEVRERFGASVATFVVTPQARRPSDLPEHVRVLLDPDAELEKEYRAATECVYVLRPDLYIGYRSQPADQAKLVAWLRSILRG